MDERRRLVIGGAVGAMLLALTVSIAWPQVQEVLRPRPFEVTLQPDRADAAALEQARATPLARRLGGVLAQQTNFAPAVAASDVPVLAPPEAGLLRTAQFHPGDRQYTLTVEREGQVIEIYGATRALQPPPGATWPPAAAPARPAAATTAAARAPATPAAAVARAEARGLEDVRSERTEYGVDVSFTRFGAAYSVTFVCDTPGAADCSEAAAIQFAASLELVGGGER
jgi:hypothetical protein